MHKILIGLLLVGPSLCWAEATVIYRKSDKLVASYIPDGSPHRSDVELQNVLNSQLGGLKSDYAVVAAPPLPPGYEYVVQADGTVTTQEHPQVTKQRGLRQSAITKLKALGLTDEEITAVLKP